MSDASREQAQLGPSADGSVMLDIGGEIGALIIETGPDLLLAEIEISRVDGESPMDHDEHGHTHDGHEHAHTHSHGDGGVRTHVAVRERIGPSGTRYAAIYHSLRQGEYTVWGLDGAAAGTVTVVGGEVAQLDWTWATSRMRSESRPVGSRHRAESRLTARLRGSRFAGIADWSPRRRLAASSVVAALVAAAVVGIVTLPDSQHPPTPPAPQAAAAPRVVQTPTRPYSPTEHGGPKFTCRKPSHDGSTSAPTRVCIPGIRVDASVMKLGLNSDRTVEVPPLSRVRDAGWYRYSAAPGAMGPTVVLGHVDSAQYGDGVFYRLSRLKRGDTVMINRADGKIATFVVDRVSEVSKKSFPTDSVYGPTSGPAIRLVTCGGRFDSSTGSYLDNIIAYGTLRSLRAA